MRRSISIRWAFPTIILLLSCFIPSCARTAAPAPTFTPSPPAATRTPAPTATPTLAPGQQAVTLALLYPLNNNTQISGTFRFLLYLPKAYYQDTNRLWPLVLFLHGSGEAGNDVNQLTQTGLPQRLQKDTDFPFIVVSPQIPAPPQSQTSATYQDIEAYLNTWGWGPQIPKLEVLLAHLEDSLRVDTRRVYLTGLSLGGFGAWKYALAYPDRFAAVVPIAGGYHAGDNALPEDLCNLNDLPIWVFHGKMDTMVDYQLSQVLVDGLQACGSQEVKFTLLPNGEHDVWSEAYTDPAVWGWLLTHERTVGD